MERAWYYWEDERKKGYFLAFVNARGNCSMRRFDSDNGSFIRKEFGYRNYQTNFSTYIKEGSRLSNPDPPPNLQECERRGLPREVLFHLQRQLHPKA